MLRAVNVGGRKLPMAGLRTLAAGIGWEDVQTYIQSGNVVFSASGSAAALEKQLEAAIGERFDMEVPVIVRTAAQWKGFTPPRAFSKAAEDEPNRLMLVLSKRAPASGAEPAIEARAADGERVVRAGDALWIHYPGGAGRSKLTPALIDRAIGSHATARNLRTVLAIGERL